MREVIITQDMLDAAQLRADNMPILNNSVTNQSGIMYGFVGEEMVAAMSPEFNIIGDNEGVYDYDIMSNDGLRLEVKTKRTKVTPRGSYEVSVYDLNTNQACDLYVFTRVNMDMSKGWVLGVMPHDEYYLMARVLKKGDIDGGNKFVVRSDQWNVKIADLYQV